MTRFAVLALLLAACGDGGGGTPVDAPPMADAPTGTVLTVTCPGTPDAMVGISAGGLAYDPMTQTVSLNAVVKFVMTATHDAKPNPLTTTDPGLTVGFGETKCLKFTAAGTFGFFCTAHGFSGTITVQ